MILIQQMSAKSLRLIPLNLLNLMNDDLNYFHVFFGFLKRAVENIR